MQIEVYEMNPTDSGVTITLTAVCDSFSSLLWDVQYYGCGNFEVYIAANARIIEIFQTGRIIGRDDDKQHYGIIESVTLETDAENGDYLTVTGRFLMSLLSRRIIYPTLSFSALTSYANMVRLAVYRNCMQSDNRLIPGLRHGSTSGTCWEQKSRLQETSAGSGVYTMMLDLSQGMDRSILQEHNAHIVFSDSYCNLLTFGYSIDLSAQKNVAYVLGCGEGAERKRTVCYRGDEPASLSRYEVYVDAKDVSDETQENGETVQISDDDYLGLLMEKGAENLVPITEISEPTIATDNRQYQYNKDYFVGDYVTVEHERFGLIQPRIQLVGMIESYDQNGRTLTPTFRKGFSL